MILCWGRLLCCKVWVTNVDHHHWICHQMTNSSMMWGLKFWPSSEQNQQPCVSLSIWNPHLSEKNNYCRLRVCYVQLNYRYGWFVDIISRINDTRLIFVTEKEEGSFQPISNRRNVQCWCADRRSLTQRICPGQRRQRCGLRLHPASEKATPCSTEKSLTVKIHMY